MNHYRISALALVAMTAFSAAAQSTQSGYFNDGYLFRHEMNPAIANRQSYVALPVLGNINISERGNIGVGDFVYSRNGQTVSFMHPDVSVEDAIKPFDHRLKLENNIRLDLISVGIADKKGKGYTTVDLGVRSAISGTVPGQLFRLAKEGPANQTYDLSDLKFRADAYGELAVGHSHKIGEKVSVGGKVKLLFGVAHLDAMADGTELTLGEEAWEATVNAEVNASMKGLAYTTDTEMRGPEGQETPHTYVDGIEVDKPGLGGFGAALDLGVTYQPIDGLTLGAAVVDLGGIKWSNNMRASTDGPHSVSTSEYHFSADDNDPDSFEEEFERLGDAISDLYEIKDMGDQGGRFTGIGTTINISAEYAMPFYKPLSVGVLNTTRLQSSGNWNETRISLNVAPCNWFAFSLGGGFGTFGGTFGGMLSIHPKGFNFYAGVDCIPAPFDKNGIPLGRNFQANFGIAFPF